MAVSAGGWHGAHALAGHDVIVAGRSGGRAAAFCAQTPGTRAAVADPLAPALRAIHGVLRDDRASGTATVICGINPLARLIAATMRFQPPGDHTLHLDFVEQDGVERWTRTCGKHGFQPPVAARRAAGRALRPAPLSRRSRERRHRSDDGDAALVVGRSPLRLVMAPAPWPANGKRTAVSISTSDRAAVGRPDRALSRPPGAAVARVA